VRKELALLAIAHRNAYVLQGSQANPSHLLAGVIRGLHLRRPAVFSLHCPCPPEHGLPDDGANRAAKLALESRAFPILVYDPELGDTPAECLSLEGNPALDETWPAYDLKYLDENGVEQVLSLPLTIADWAATESRFRRHFSPVAADAEEETLVPFHQYLELAPEERDGKTPFIWTLDRDRHLIRFQASGEIVALAEDRQRLWRQLKQTAGLEVADSVREMIGSELEAEFQRKAAEIRAGYERQIAELQQKYPQVIARRLAELLLKSDGNRTITEILSSLPDAPAGAPARRFDTAPAPAPAPIAAAGAAAPPAATAQAAAPAAAGNGVAVEEPLVIEPWIDTARCTSCDECTGINRKLFAYNDKKQAYIKDPKAGSFKDLVTAAERCPVGIIHPGTPLNPKEKGLDKLLARAARFA
jgi:pyruvate-ferredoxin/flavodoxin oxidoreductase